MEIITCKQKQETGKILRKVALQEASAHIHDKTNTLATDEIGNTYEVDEHLNPKSQLWEKEFYQISNDKFVASFIDASNAILNGSIYRLNAHDEVEEIER